MRRNRRLEGRRRFEGWPCGFSNSVRKCFRPLEMNIMEVVSVTGHSTISMLQRYTHLSAVTLAGKLG